MQKQKTYFGRDPIKLDNKNINNLIKGKVVLVTGGGGSIGSELCRQIMRFEPKRLVIVDIYENNLFDSFEIMYKKQIRLHDTVKACYCFDEDTHKVVIKSLDDKKIHAIVILK